MRSFTALGILLPSLFAVFLFTTNVANAEVVGTQSDATTLSSYSNFTSGNKYSFNQILGDGLTGTAYSFTFKSPTATTQWNDVISYQGLGGWSLLSCTVPWDTSTGSCSGTSDSHSVNNVTFNGEFVTAQFTTPVTLSSPLYYVITIQTALNQDVDWSFYGSSSGSCSYYLYNYQTATFSDTCTLLSPIKSIYWQLSGSGGFEPPTSSNPPQRNTRHIQIIKPYYNETVTNSHDIEIDFINPQFGADNEVTLDIQIKDYLTGAIEYDEQYVMATTTVDGTFLDTASTTDGSKFITARLYSETRTYPTAQGFYNVNTNTYLQQTGVETPNSGTQGLSTINSDCATLEFGCQIQRAFTFLFVPDRGLVTTLLDIEDQLQQKIPFKYFYGTVAMWEDLTVSTTTLPSLPVTYWNNQDPIDIFATSTVNTFVPTSVINVFKLLATSAIWLAVLFYFWQMRLRVFNTKS